jgi:hypothetical protein
MRDGPPNHQPIIAYGGAGAALPETGFVVPFTFLMSCFDEARRLSARVTLRLLRFFS